MDINEPRNPDNQHEDYSPRVFLANSTSNRAWWDEFRRLNPDLKFDESVSYTSGGAQGRIYTSAEQELRAQVERQQRIIDELVRTLGNVTAEIWGNVDADEVIIHTSDGKAAHVTPKTAKAYRAALELIEKYGGGK